MKGGFYGKKYGGTTADRTQNTDIITVYANIGNQSVRQRECHMATYKARFMKPTGLDLCCSE
jgi:hypothetical protein